VQNLILTPGAVFGSQVGEMSWRVGKRKRGKRVLSECSASAQRVGKFSCGVMDFPGTRRRTPASANAACGCETAPMLG
jgi:hypothetical protein